MATTGGRRRARARAGARIPRSPRPQSRCVEVAGRDQPSREPARGCRKDEQGRVSSPNYLLISRLRARATGGPRGLVLCADLWHCVAGCGWIWQARLALPGGYGLYRWRSGRSLPVGVYTLQPKARSLDKGTQSDWEQQQSNKTARQMARAMAHGHSTHAPLPTHTNRQADRQQARNASWQGTHQGTTMHPYTNEPHTEPPNEPHVAHLLVLCCTNGPLRSRRVRI